MDYFPVFVKLKDQDCLVIGAGEIAARKIELLARAGAKITVIAKKVSPQVLSLETSCHLNLLQKSFAPTDLRGFRLVVSATDNRETNQLVAKTAEEQNILVNVVDNPELCSFIFPENSALSRLLNVLFNVSSKFFSKMRQSPISGRDYAFYLGSE